MASSPVLVIGLDGAPERYVLEAPPGALPNLQALMARGLWGPLTSTIPPITCPAWACMSTSRDPGQLGLYGFRNRTDFSYPPMERADASWIHAPRVWEILSDMGHRSVVLGVPLTYPVRAFDGWLVSSFLGPGPAGDYTHPAGLADEIRQVAPGYMVDVPDFRTDDKERLLSQIYRMTDERFKLAVHLMRTRPWDLFWLVEMGSDRMHHGFWRYGDPDHRLHQPGHPYEHAIADYYRHLDGWVGELLQVAPDDATVFVVSDHGAKTLTGAISMNDWLRREGYLVMKHLPDVPAPLDPAWVDWSRTRLWAEGGYYARIFVNGLGREPMGIVPSSEYESLLDDVSSRLVALRDHERRPMASRAMRPADLYREVRGIAPDLIVYLGDLDWRSAGTVGHRDIYLLENDTGPDDANHSQEGIFVLAGPGVAAPGRYEGASLLDVAPTIMAALGHGKVEGMLGESLEGRPRCP
ncbi:MAG: phosphodiesterase [Armatimonadia bacterium]|nr:phosphodiesterase [Armatimonadia bacterium]